MKYKYQNQSEIPAELAAHYTQRDGAFVLNVEDAVERSQLDALTRERDQLQQRFAGIDPDAARKLEAEKRRLEEAQQLKAGEFEKVLETRLQAARTDFDKQLSGLTTERDLLSEQLAKIQIDQAVLTAATEHGLHPSAIPDLLARAHATFRMVKGVPTAFEADGQTVRKAKEGKSLQPTTWVEDLTTEAPHLFHPGGGSQATGNKTEPARTPTNPFSRENWNLTEQMRLFRIDPSRAEALKAVAR